MAESARATFFISTGRCATQWVHKTLADAFPDTAVVTHEPILAAYNPRRFLRAGDRLPELLQDPVVAEHIAMIRRTLGEGRPYVEAGWPCYPALPLLVGELGGRVNFVHLVRNPVFTAFSLATHLVYDRDDWIASGAITPDDPGVVQKELASSWKKMGMYEKCLFWWTEINLYGLDLRREHPTVPYLLVRYEDLFAPGEPATLRRMVEHCGLAFTAELAAARARTVDDFRQKAEPADWELIFRYPRTVSLARELGYPLDAAQSATIEDRVSSRYQVHGLRERVRGRWHGLRRRLGRVKRLLRPE
jgi:hypothetical protein